MPKRLCLKLKREFNKNIFHLIVFKSSTTTSHYSNVPTNNEQLKIDAESNKFLLLVLILSLLTYIACL